MKAAVKAYAQLSRALCRFWSSVEEGSFLIGSLSRGHSQRGKQQVHRAFTTLRAPVRSQRYALSVLAPLAAASGTGEAVLAGFLALTGALLPADHFRTMVLVVDHMHQLGVMHRYALSQLRSVPARVSSYADKAHYEC